jgi:hypothetical protein
VSPCPDAALTSGLSDYLTAKAASDNLANLL